MISAAVKHSYEESFRAEDVEEIRAEEVAFEVGRHLVMTVESEDLHGDVQHQQYAFEPIGKRGVQGYHGLLYPVNRSMRWWGKREQDLRFQYPRPVQLAMEGDDIAWREFIPGTPINRHGTVKDAGEIACSFVQRHQNLDRELQSFYEELRLINAFIYGRHSVRPARTRSLRTIEPDLRYL